MYIYSRKDSLCVFFGYLNVSYLPEKCYVSDCQSESINLAESLFVRKRGHVNPQFVEGRVYTAKITNGDRHF